MIRRMRFPAFLCMFVVAVTALGFVPAHAVELDRGAELSIAGARLYCIVPLITDGDRQVFACGGQISPIDQFPRVGETKQYGYLLIVERKGSGVRILAEDLFTVRHGEKDLPGRVRNLAVIAHPGGTWEIAAAGTGGGGEDEENGAVGFLHKATWSGESLLDPMTYVFSDPRRKFTDGYCVQAVDLNGDGRKEIVYGGFSTDGEGKADYLDMRAFRVNDNGTLSVWPEKPFARLTLPMRINALLADDVDQDGQAELIAAGRTFTGPTEKAVMAVWRRGGAVSQSVVKEFDISRFRCLMAADLDNDGTKEILAGGRIDLPNGWETIIMGWRFTHGILEPFSSLRRYSETKIRLRALARIPGTSGFLGAGRRQEGKKKSGWTAYIQSYGLEGGKIVPAGESMWIKSGFDTRIRDMVITGDKSVYTAGFVMDESKNATGLMTFYRLR